MRNELLICGLVIATATTACQHSGGGAGTLEAPAAQGGGSQAKGTVAFTWHSKADPSKGSIQATMPNGKQFSGTYLQVTSRATADDYGAYYGVWRDPGWGSPWYNGPSAGFVTMYSGQAVAHLKADNGTRMRCKFALREPESGLAGGGDGDCQLTDNRTVFDARLKSGL
jgi:hypothetical protein